MSYYLNNLFLFTIYKNFLSREINNAADNSIKSSTILDKNNSELLKENVFDKQNIHENETLNKKFKQTDQTNEQPKQTVGPQNSTKIQVQLSKE